MRERDWRGEGQQARGSRRADWSRVGDFALGRSDMARSPARRDARDRRDHDYRRRSRDRDGPVGRYSRYRPTGNLPRQQRRHDDRYDDRSYGRYDDRRDRGSGRPRSRERKRSREGSPVRDRERDRDRRERGRYADDRDYNDRDRDSKRARRDDDQPSRRHRGDSRDRRADSERGREVHTLSEAQSRNMLNGQTPRQSAAEVEEEAKKARQAKVEAWKKKQLLKKGIDPTDSPAASNSGTSSPTAQLDQNGITSEDTAAPGKKFDHKAIAKRAAAAMEREKQKTALGGDVSIPKSTGHAPAADASKLANNTKATSSVANGKLLRGPFQ